MPEGDQTLDLAPGAEDEDDAQPRLEGLRRAVVAGSDWTTETLVGQLRKGNIELNPRFQRREVWTEKRKSAFIESILLNLPIPQVVLAERLEDPNTFLVLDGKQRLLTLRQFTSSPRRKEDADFDQHELTALSILKNLEGKDYDSLTPSDKNAFDNHTVRTVVIRHWDDPNFLYQVFIRLNTGNVQLSPQELRQALIPGPFVEYADEFSIDSSTLHAALGNDGPDFRMRDTEILVRFFAFANFISSYRGNLKDFLDGACRRLNAAWEEHESKIRRQATQCEKAIRATISIFGEEAAFTRWRDGQFEGRFNRAVFDVMTFYFRTPTVASQARAARQDVREAFKRLCQRDHRFSEAITTTTKSKENTFYRLAKWGRSLKRLGIAVAIPKEPTSKRAKD